MQLKKETSKRLFKTTTKAILATALSVNTLAATAVMTATGLYSTSTLASAVEDYNSELIQFGVSCTI